MVQPTFTANIAVYNQLDNLKIILRALEKQTYDDFEIIVCDDGSSDGTKDFMRQWYPEVKYFWQEDKGFRLAKSKNNGISAAEGKYFVSLEGDVVPHPTLLEEYEKVMDDKTIALGVRHDIEMFPEELDFEKYDSYVVQRDFRIPQLRQIEKIYNPWRLCSGCNVCFPTDKLKEVGGWNEDYEHYGYDDYEVCLRMVMAGCEIIACEEAYGYHLKHPLRESTAKNEAILKNLERKYHESSN